MKNIIIFSLISFLLVSCEKEITLDNKYAKQKLVVNAVLEVDSTMKMYVFKSNLPLKSDIKFEPIKNATVVLEDGAGYKSNLVYDGSDIIKVGVDSGFYSSSDIVKGNTNYKLEIETKEFKITKSEIVVPTKPVILDFEFKYVEDYSTIDFVIEDDASTEDFYFFEVFYIYYYSYFDGVDTIVDGPYAEPQYLEEQGEGSAGEEFFQATGSKNLINDKFFNGKNIKNSFKIVNYSEEDYGEEEGGGFVPQELTSIKLNISSINKDYYNYLISVNKQLESQQDPFSESVSVTNNIDNGVGIFGVRNTFHFVKEF